MILILTLVYLAEAIGFAVGWWLRGKIGADVVRDEPAQIVETRT